MRIWPAIDIRGGSCVRLRQGDYQQETVYGANPADMALRFVNDGAEGLHLVDLDGARDGQLNNFDAIESVARQVDVPIQIGGGIRDAAAIERYLDIGIKRLVIGTRAIADTPWTIEMIEQYPAKIIIGLDARNGFAATDGWQTVSNIDVVEFAKEISRHPIAGIIYTDISKDGMLAGPNFEAMHEMQQAVSVPIIASGGVTSQEDVTQLAQLGLAGCIIGRALYEGHVTLGQALAASEEGALNT